MNSTKQYLITCDYGEWDDARSVPILVAPSEPLAVSIAMEIQTKPDSDCRRLVLDVLGDSSLPYGYSFGIREIHVLAEESNQNKKQLLTKDELAQRLRDGASMGDLFELMPGQECEIFKAKMFAAGPQILYIPDIAFNDIPVNEPVSDSAQQIEYILSECFTGDDFIKECSGNAELAERLFSYCDWQHPSSALPEVDDEDESQVFFG